MNPFDIINVILFITHTLTGLVSDAQRARVSEVRVTPEVSTLAGPVGPGSSSSGMPGAADNAPREESAASLKKLLDESAP